MRSKNSYKAIIILGLVMFLSVGYAVVSSVSLSITGTTISATESLDVVFNGNYSISNTTKGTANVESGGKTATFTATDMVLNEAIAFTYEVQNNEIDLGARVTASVTNNNDYFYVDIQEVSNRGTTINFDIAPSSTTTIKVTAKLKQTPISESDSSSSFTVSISALPINSEDAIPTTSTQISFSVFSVGSYTADAGMTWEDFVNSEYNTTGFTISDNQIVVYGYSVKDVLPTDVILNGVEYSWSGCCFDAGSKILMADGTTKNIEDVQVGDMIISLNEDTGEFITQKVAQTITNKNSTDLVYVYLSNGTKLGMRAYHPLLTTEGWKSLRPNAAETIKELGKVELLEVGDTLVGYNENPKIVSVEQRPEVENYYTYTLNVEGYHNYIVDGVVAHNKGCK